MPSHHRGRSLSESFTLEQSEEGGLVISSINNNASTNQGVREGDEILGATINFDQLSKEEVFKVLKLMEPFDDKVQVLTRSNMSKSLDNLDQSAKTPETMLKESYNKLYNTKIKKFMKGDLLDAERGYENSQLTVAGSSKVSLKQDLGLPRIGVDFGRLKTKTLSTDIDADSESHDATFSARTARELTDGANLNLPPLGLGLSGPALSGVQVPRNQPTGLEDKGTLRAPEIGGSDISTPEMGINLYGGNGAGPSFDTGVPKVGIEGTNKEFTMPKFKIPDLGLSGPSFSGPETNTPDIGHPRIPSEQLNLKYSKKMKKPDLNVDDLSCYAKSPKLRLSGQSPDLDLEMPGVNVSQLNLNGPDIDMPSGEVKVPFRKPKIDLKSPDLDVDAPSGKLTLPKIGLPGKVEADVKTPDLSLRTPKIKGGISAPGISLPKTELKGTNLSTDTPSVNIKGRPGKYKAPKFKMPKFDLPDIQVPDFEGPDVHLDAPGLKAGIADLNVPSPSGKLKMPSFGHKVKAPDYELKTPDMDMTTPKFEGGIKFPAVDLKDPKLDLNNPSGKLDIDADSPSGKLKLPKFKLFGTLPKNKDVDINTGMKTPELTLKSPKIKGIDAPGVSSPNMDLKMPKLNFPSLKGPNIDGDLDGPDVDINAPNFNLKGPKADLDLDIAGPSGKFKKPNLNLPNMGLSSPKLDIPKLDVKTPDLDISAPSLSGGLNPPDLNMPKVDLKSPKLDLNAPNVNLDMPSGKLKMPNLKGPKIKGGIDAPDLDLPNMDFKAPTLDVNTPDVNIGSPKTKLKMPKLKMPKVTLSGLKGPEIDGDLNGPDFDINAPNVNFKGSKPSFEMPDVDFRNPSGKIKKPHLKMPDVGFSSPKLDHGDFDLKSPDLHAKLPKGPELKTPDLNLKAPKMKGGLDAPKLGLPNMDLKAPKLDMNAPDVNIGLPDAKLKKPKIKMPKGPNVDINGDLHGPDLNIPNVDVNVPKAHIGRPEMNFTAPEVKGGIRGPDFVMNVPKGNMALQGPQTDLDLADRKFKLPSFQVPQLGSPDLRRTGSDIDFGASLRPAHLDISPPNAKMNVKPPELTGNIRGPRVNAPNMDLNMPKMTMQNPQLHLKSPDLNLDSPSLNYKGLSYKNRKSDMTGMNMRMPVLDIDGDMRLSHIDRQSQRTQVRSIFPGMDADFGHHFDFDRSDLNIDDFTGKEHVLRARGSKLDTHTSHNYGQVISPSGVNIDMMDPRHTRRVPAGDAYSKHHRTMQPGVNGHLPHFSQDSRIRVPGSSDEYYVTAFPNQTQNQRLPNRKYNTLGGLDFNSGNIDLEVPYRKDLKGSKTIFLSNLV